MSINIYARNSQSQISRQNKTLQQSFLYHVTGEGAFAKHFESLKKAPSLSHIRKGTAEAVPFTFHLIKSSLLNLDSTNLVLRNAGNVIVNGIGQFICIAIREVEGHEGLALR